MVQDIVRILLYSRKVRVKFSMLCVYSLSCYCAWRMSKIQPSQWSSVYRSGTLLSSVGFTSVASRGSSTRWFITWRLPMTLPTTTSSGSAPVASKVSTSSVEFDMIVLCQWLIRNWHHGHVKVKVEVNVDLYSASSWTHL